MITEQISERAIATDVLEKALKNTEPDLREACEVVINQHYYILSQDQIERVWVFIQDILDNSEVVA